MLFPSRTGLVATASLYAAVTLSSAQDIASDSNTVTAATTEDPWLASGCSMAQGTALMLCLGDYASIPPAAPSGLPELNQAAYYCDIYTQLANCWAAGLYCKEWYPMRVAADKFCALANITASATDGLPSPTTTLPPSSTSQVGNIGIGGAGIADMPTPAPAASASNMDSSAINSTLSSVIAEASNVITSIWNNDSGTDIPVISNDIASETIPTWTQMTTSTPLPATDPLGTSTSTMTVASITSLPARMRRKIVLE
ncbi:hypothetical protein P389DRAFT_10294 [Cystobasidium minutum MCA 4210]|uniref:uncharacterized protein n=1 Tax=Cystobasidium minutum MCA 4210 TaxID=1397322 RepID=UPI0034CED125|eukprot:jgi/Rhomi1/10294/CE10293_884